MLEQVSNLWQQNKVKFLMVAIPVVLLLIAAIFLKAYRQWLLDSAKKLMQTTQAKDKELSQAADQANQEANDHKAKADQLAQQEKEVDKDDDADWNKKL